ncbi:DsrE family protein [Thiofilum flexile]|uniref:DsrE family protein n=1 Tax=Thiofilum flexile TaxID=125627 RepID=UPI000379E91D|nr:DsrE family protein [Thiofilum flexile]
MLSRGLGVGLLLVVLVGVGTFLPPSYAAESSTAVQQSHRLVIQMNKNDTDLQDQVLSNIVNLQKHYGLDEIEIELVAYGAGIWFLTEQSAFKARIESLMLQNVVFTACGNTLDMIAVRDGKRPPLIEGVELTQTGLARLIERQEQGWSYLSP